MANGTPRRKLAVTSWGPGIFEPAEPAWWAAERRERPDLYSRDNPWDQIIDPDFLLQLFADRGILNADIATEEGRLYDE